MLSSQYRWTRYSWPRSARRYRRTRHRRRRSRAALPTPDQLSNLCNQATDPGVSYTTKNNLVENGISPDEGHVADHDLRKAYRNGNFPETFAVTNIAPAGPNMAQADVAISGPKFAGPVQKHLVFVNQGGNWILQHDAAIALIQAATATN